MSVSHKYDQTQQLQAVPRLALSACLAGRQVRYDGTDKRHPFITDVLMPLLELVPVCPEVEIGMGVPRPTIHVVEAGGEPRAVGVSESGLDVTAKLNRYGLTMARRLADIDGYIFKARSPSCGVSSTPVRKQHGGWKKGAGLFAARIMQQLPLLPVVEESALDSPERQINFIQRVEAYRRWRGFVVQRPGLKQLHQFHQQQRLNLMAHGAEGVRRLERWLATLTGRLRHGDLQRYGAQYIQQFTHQATRRRHLVVLRHIAAQCRASLDQQRYIELRQLIEAYAQNEQQLETMLTELKRLLQNTALAGQSYLQPGLEFRLYSH